MSELLEPIDNLIRHLNYVTDRSSNRVATLEESLQDKGIDARVKVDDTFIGFKRFGLKWRFYIERDCRSVPFANAVRQDKYVIILNLPRLLDKIEYLRNKFEKGHDEFLDECLRLQSENSVRPSTN